MYSAAEIVTVAGESGLTYAQNKNRGGRSSAKGRDFEIVYGAYRVALAAAEAFRTGGLGAGISFHDQVQCFVDDFIASGPDGRTLSQLKSGAAHWNGGDHPLVDDFELQAKLDAVCGVVAAYELVVGDDGQRDTLIASRPAGLGSVSVVSFPGGLSDLELIDRLGDLADALTELSPRPPERIVREQVWRMLLGTWQGSRGDQSLATLVNNAGHGPGAIVAPLLPPYVLSDAAIKALDNVAGLRFYIRKNFFVFEALRGMQQGVADYHCHTPEFEGFVTNLLIAKPTDFFGFWDVLKAHV